MAYKIFLLLLGWTATTYSFDVKVLLQKINLAELSSSSLEIASPHGFVISNDPSLVLGAVCKSKNLRFTFLQNKMMINDRPVSDKMIYISPALSSIHTAALKLFISDWIKTYEKELDSLSEPLHELFDQMVAPSLENKTQPEYNLLDLYVEHAVELFLQNFLETIDADHRVTFVTLTQYMQDFLQTKAQQLFLENLAHEQLTKQDRKHLQKDKKYRYSFFAQQLRIVLQQLLDEFVPALPRKLLQQFLKEDIGHIAFQGNSYLGSFAFFQEKQQLYMINNLDIDDYLLSVIRHEGWPGWSLEVNKLLAIICRTYLVWQVLQAQKAKRPYHIENGIKHQTYKGHHNSEKLKKAVEETKDLFVAYDDKPALTMYDACCGGIIPSKIDDPNIKQYNYLARSYPCTFCKGFKIFHWRTDIAQEELLAKLKKDYPQIKKIVDITIHKRDKAGLVKKLSINVGTKKIIISEKKMKLLVPTIKSSCYDIIHAHKKYFFEGTGYGHHRGLCQWGAMKLIRDEHWNFGQVIQFYYPGTKLMKLTYQR